MPAGAGGIGTGGSSSGGAGTGGSSSVCGGLDPCPLQNEVPYQLIPGHAPSMCVNVRAWGTAAGARAQQFTNKGQRNQVFWAEDRGYRYFSLRSALSAKCLGVAGASLDPGAFIEQTACTGDAAQLFRPEAAGGLVRLVARHSGLDLNVAGTASTAASALLVQNPDDGLADSTWDIVPATESAFLTLSAVEQADLRARHVDARVVVEAATGPDSEWKFVSGLGNTACVSFESKDEPGHFMHHVGNDILSESPTGNSEFPLDATFCFVDPLQDLGAGYRSIEPANVSGKYLARVNGRVVLAAFEDTDAFRAAATWSLR